MPLKQVSDDRWTYTLTTLPSSVHSALWSGIMSLGPPIAIATGMVIMVSDPSRWILAGILGALVIALILCVLRFRQWFQLRNTVETIEFGPERLTLTVGEGSTASSDMVRREDVERVTVERIRTRKGKALIPRMSGRVRIVTPSGPVDLMPGASDDESDSIALAIATWAELDGATGGTDILERTSREDGAGPSVEPAEVHPELGPLAHSPSSRISEADGRLRVEHARPDQKTALFMLIFPAAWTFFAVVLINQMDETVGMSAKMLAPIGMMLLLFVGFVVLPLIIVGHMYRGHNEFMVEPSPQGRGVLRVRHRRCLGGMGLNATAHLLPGRPGELVVYRHLDGSFLPRFGVRTLGAIVAMGSALHQDDVPYILNWVLDRADGRLVLKTEKVVEREA